LLFDGGTFLRAEQRAATATTDNVAGSSLLARYKRIFATAFLFGYPFGLATMHGTFFAGNVLRSALLKKPSS
jgi:hypothetical protein